MREGEGEREGEDGRVKTGGKKGGREGEEGRERQKRNLTAVQIFPFVMRVSRGIQIQAIDARIGNSFHFPRFFLNSRAQRRVLPTF
jgi:hypothetical protein